MRDLQILSEKAKLSGLKHPLQRAAVASARAATGKEFLGLIGPRGAGKTVALQQLAAGTPGSFYLSIDLLDRRTDLFTLLNDLVATYHPPLILLDEIHFNATCNQALKNAYDFLDTRIVFSSSVALEMIGTSTDLSRRVRLLSVPYFSFSEYVQVETGTVLAPFALEQLLSPEATYPYLEHDHRFRPYLRGGMCPFAADVTDVLNALERIVQRVLQDDLPQAYQLTPDEVAEVASVLKFIGRSHHEDINPSSIAKNCGIARTRGVRYIELLELAFLLIRVWPPESSNVLREPKVLMHPPLRLLYRDEADAIGGLREDFAAWALRQTGHAFHYLKNKRGKKCPDFLVQGQPSPLIVEVGGKGKGTTQFKGVSSNYPKVVLKEAPPYSEQRRPLWSLGLLAAGSNSQR